MQEENQNIEITEVEPAVKQQNIKDRIRNFYSNKRGWVITGISAAVILAAVAGTVAVKMNGGKEPVMAANDHIETAQQTTAASTQPATQKETESVKLRTMKLEAVADESSITAKVLDETGSPFTGYTFVVNLLQGSVQDNHEAIDKFNAVYDLSQEGTTAADVEERKAAANELAQAVHAQQFPDEDQDGEIAIRDLDAGTYTLMVQAEQGFDVPSAQEVTITRYEVIENIMDEVILENEDTKKEDPQGNREEPAEDKPAPPSELPPVVDDSPKEDDKPVQQVITSLKRVDGQIVYRADFSTDILLTDSQVAAYPSGSAVIEENGGTVVKEGYIYQKGFVETTGEGTVEVVTQFLVLSEASVSANASGMYTILQLAPVIEENVQEVFEDGWNWINGTRYYYMDGQPYTGWHWIEGINYYFNADGALSSRVVIDVSTYNGSIDWNAVKAAGIDYAMIRVGYRGWGTARLVLDSRFDENMRGASAAGIQVGAYIVTQAINTAEAVEEASFIIEKCRSYNVTLPLAIDVEWAGDSDEEGRANGLSANERTSIINAFSETVRNAGYTPMVYANKNWMTNYINAAGLVPFCKVWVAQYADIDCTTYGGRFDMWQFRSDGRVNGIGGNVDMSAWVF